MLHHLLIQVQGTQLRPNYHHLGSLKDVGSNPACFASPEGLYPNEEAKRSTARQIWSCVSIIFSLLKSIGLNSHFIGIK